jgi:TolA-binding protein
MSRLDVALRQLREDTTGQVTEAEADATLLRTLASARRQSSFSRPQKTALLLVAATLLLASLAWAAASGRLFRGITPAVRAPAPPSTIVNPLGTAQPAMAETAVVTPAASARGAESVQSAAPAKASAAASAAAPSATYAAMPNAESRDGARRSSKELAAYDRAHRAHFEQANPEQALRLWDDYLREFPGTRWVPEARYNRALCLLRLGRTEQARQELVPFAKGAYGGYRQREAQNLLDATESTTQ